MPRRPTARRLAAGAARGGGPALGPASPPPAPLRPGGQDPCPGRRRVGLRTGDRPAPAQPRPRIAPLAADPPRDRPDGRYARDRLRPPGRRGRPPDWIEAAVAGARSWASPAARLALGQVAATAAEVLARSSLR